MGNTRDLSNRINESYSRLSKGQKLLATYITDNYDKAVFLTAARLGEVVGVSEKQAEFDPAYGSDLWKNQSVENIGIGPALGCGQDQYHVGENRSGSI